MACVLNFQSHWPSVPPPMGWCDRWLAGSLLGNLASGGLAGTPGYRGACWDTCGRQHTWHTAQGLGTHLLPTYLCTYLSTHLPTYLSIYLSMPISIYLLPLPISLSAYLSIHPPLPIYLSIYPPLSIYLSIYLPICLPLSIYLAMSISIYLVKQSGSLPSWPYRTVPGLACLLCCCCRSGWSSFFPLLNTKVQWQRTAGPPPPVDESKPHVRARPGGLGPRRVGFRGYVMPTCEGQARGLRA